jgi:hypothetical protein
VRQGAPYEDTGGLGRASARRSTSYRPSSTPLVRVTGLHRHAQAQCTQARAGIEVATAARTHQRIAQGTAALRDADARYRPAAAGRISTTPTTQKPRISGARGVRGSSHAAESAWQVPPYSLRLTAFRITSAGQDPPYVGRVLTRRTAVSIKMVKEKFETICPVAI